MTKPPTAYKDPSLPIQERVTDLVSRMTLEEKVSQMIHDSPAIERLDVPAHNWWNECLHGLGRAGIATVFPQAIGLGAMWNDALLFEIATVISDEARAKHHQALSRGIHDIYFGLSFWTPNINIVRDPRWGRGQETYGECPHLTARMGVAFVKGLQGDDPKHLKLVATPKHYAAHNGPEPLRHEFDAQVSERDLRQTYLPAFEACVKEAGAYSIMGAYSRTNGVPCCAHPRLLQEILRDEWGFEGYVVSDCRAIHDIHAHHKVVETAAEASAMAVKAGCELNCGETYPALLEAVEQGLIDEETIDRAVSQLFTARFRLGMFDPPEQVAYAQIPIDVIDSPEHQALALQAARESIVLLKNDGLLPLDKKNIGSVAVIGPTADDLFMLLGNYHGTPARPVTPLEGLRNKLGPSTEVLYARGCQIAAGVSPLTPIPSAYLRPAEDSDQCGLHAAYYDGLERSGEPALTRTDPNVDFYWREGTPLDKQHGEHFSARWSGYLVPPVSGSYKLGINGFNRYQLTLDGEPIAQYNFYHHPRVKVATIELEAGRPYKIELEYGNYGPDPQVHLLWSVPGVDYETEAIEAATKADVVIACLGLSPRLEGEELQDEGGGGLLHVEGFHGGDRTDISLPRTQQELLKRIHALGKPTVLVLLSGSAVSANWADENIPAIVQAWYPGQSGGDAIADVLFGDYTPGGRLPVTIYKSVDDLPPFEEYAMEGHTYRYFQGEPLYPFGHGLSYTTFAYTNLELGARDIAPGQSLTVSVDVQNTGERAGDEVVQLYIRDVEASVPVPIRQLAGFERVHLVPGEKTTVTFTLSPRQFSLIDDEGQWAIEPGQFEIAAGGRQPTKKDVAEGNVLIETVQIK